MELEFGLKITKTRDDSTSVSEYRLAKDRTGPVFQLRETNTMFILIAHLKGYKRNNIHIKISEDGSKISISGEKPVQEMLMLGGVMFKKDVEIMSFSKVFKIPDGVILDWIKAKYDEEEWMLKIVMPKSVKGICGASIEEVEEDKSDRGRSEELERRENDHILDSFGETSGKGTKEFEVQETEDGGRVVEKEEVSSERMLDDDANVGRIKGTIKDGGGTSVRKKVGRVDYEAMKTSDSEKNVGTSIPQNIGDTNQHKESEIQETEDGGGFVEKNEGRASEKMLNDVNGGITGEKIQEEIEDGSGASVRQKGVMEAYEAMKASEVEQTVSAGIPRTIGDTSHDKESEVQEMKGNGTYGSDVEKKEQMVSDKVFDGAKGNKIGERIKKGTEESKLGIEGGEGESVGENDRKAECEAIKQLEKTIKARIRLSNGETSQELSEDAEVQQMQKPENAVEEVDRQENGKMLAKADEFSREDAYGESKQKEFEQSKSETEDIHKESVEEVISMERFEETKTSELDQDIGDHIPSNIVGSNQEKESEEWEIQQMKITESVEANNAIQENIFGKDNKKPNETANGDEECKKEKADKEGFEPVVITLREEFLKAPQEVSKGENVSKMKESKEVTEPAMVKTKDKETEYSMEKGDGEEPKGVHVEARMRIEQDITEETRQEEIEKPKIITEELPKQVGEKLSDGSKGFKDEKIQEPKDVIREAKTEAESLMQNVEGGTSKKTTKKSTETLEKENEEFGIERKAKTGLCVPDKGELDVMEGNIQEKVPKKVEEVMALDEDEKTEYGIVELKKEGSIRMNFEASKNFEEDITRDRTEKETREPKLKSRDQLRVEENIDDGGVDGSKIHELPEVGKTKDVREEGAKTEQKVNREKYEKIQVEANEGSAKDIIRETIQKELKDPNAQTNESDQCLQGKTDERSMVAKEEFPMKTADSLAGKGEKQKDTKIEEAKEVEEELVMQECEKKVGETEDTKDDAETEQYEKKVKDRCEKIQVETDGGEVKYTRETTRKETKEPEIQTEEEDQQCLQEEMSKRRPEVSNAAQEEELERARPKETMPEKAEVKEEIVKQQNEKQMEETEDVKDKGTETEQFVKKEKGGKDEKIKVEASGGISKDAMSKASTTEREFPLKTLDSRAKGRDGPKDEKMGETEKVKQEVAKRKTNETEVLESMTREKYQETEGERITKTLPPKEEHPKALDIGLDERELQPEERPTTHAKVVMMGYKELEQESATITQRSRKRKDTFESRNESVDQDIVKSKKAKEAEKGEQCTYNTESTKAVATIEDQVAKPRFSSTQQYEVGEHKLQEGCKEKYEPEKEYHTKDLQDSPEVKDQESQHMEALMPEIPLEELLKKKEQGTRKDEFQEAKKVEEANQEETEQHKNKIDDGDQQNVQQDVGKEVGTVEAIEKEMPEEEYASNAGPIVGRMETEAAPERKKDMNENVNDEKLRLKEEIKKTDSEKTQEHQSKSRAVEKGAISSLPGLTSIGVKNGITEKHHKDLSPLTPTAETKSKEYVPESRDRKQYGYGTEDIKASKSITYKGAKPSEDDKNRKSENDVEESPMRNADTEFQKSIEWSENEFQAHMLENQGLGEKHEVYGQEAAPGECDYQERNKERSNGTEISTEGRGQQYVQEDHDKKVHQAAKAVNEELSSREHRAGKIVLEKSEVPKVAGNEEPKESAKQLHKREKGKTTQIAEDKMPEPNEMTPEFEEVSRFEQDVERIQEPATTTVITPKKGMEESDTEEMPTLPTEIQSKEPYELSWSSMSTQRYQLEEINEREASDEVGNQESREEYTSTNVQYSSKSETNQEVEQVETPQPNSCNDQLPIYKDEEESQGKHEVVGEKARKLQEEECEVIIVEKEEASGVNKDKTRKTKKLLVPLVVAGSTLLISLVCIVIHRNRARKRCK